MAARLGDDEEGCVIRQHTNRRHFSHERGYWFRWVHEGEGISSCAYTVQVEAPRTIYRWSLRWQIWIYIGAETP